MNTNTSSERRRRELRWVVGTLSGVMALGAVAMIASKEMKQGNIVGAGTSRVGSAATEGSMAEVSVAPAGGAVQQLEVEMDDAGRTLLYAAARGTMSRVPRSSSGQRPSPTPNRRQRPSPMPTLPCPRDCPAHVLCMQPLPQPTAAPSRPRHHRHPPASQISSRTSVVASYLGPRTIAGDAHPARQRRR